MNTQKRSSCAQHILRPARTSVFLLYQISFEISMICSFLLIISMHLICFCLRIWPIRNFSILVSLTFFVRIVLIIMFKDCLVACFKVCSSVFALNNSGDFISYSMPSRQISALWVICSGMNSTVCPAFAKILAACNSCGQGLHFTGIIILPFLCVIMCGMYMIGKNFASISGFVYFCAGNSLPIMVLKAIRTYWLRCME